MPIQLYTTYQLIHANTIVYNVPTNPCQYSVATLQGAGLRDIDICKGFVAMVRKEN